ncbi:hypothetical protein [Paenibacillus daejeonensis]|uniref:hypothetical protein n=1 Tax=Paenibacillus daejeonensis TaxID=135193 RepID=UPI001FE0DFA4|nr:hypothetical protein [Paenibacillus daejeonensis]
MMRNLYVKLSLLVVVFSLTFCLTASANPSIVSYGSSYSHSLSPGEGYAYILPNARTSGTGVKINTAVPNSLQVKYYWSYNGTQLSVGPTVISGTSYNGGFGYYEPGTLITVVERVPGSTAGPVSYSISFN